MSRNVVDDWGGFHNDTAYLSYAYDDVSSMTLCLVIEKYQSNADVIRWSQLRSPQQSIPISILLGNFNRPIHKEADIVYQPFIRNCSI